MISAGETQRVNVPTNVSIYLEVLGQLPNVSPSDIEKTQQILQEALENPHPTTVLFQRVMEDKKIEVVQVYRAAGKADLQVPIVFDVSGNVRCQARDFYETLPASVAAYFFGGIFGAKDSSDLGTLSAINPMDDTPIPAPKVINGEETVVVLKKIEGVRDLYRCAIKKGGVKSCGESDGFGKLAEAKQLAEALRIAKEQKVAEEKRQAAEAEQRKLSQLVEKKKQKADDLWRSAEQKREAARPWYAVGSADKIQAIMDHYAIYRNYADTTDEMHNAEVRLQRAQEMIAAVDASIPKVNQSTSGASNSEERFGGGGLTTEFAEERRQEREAERAAAAAKEKPCHR